MPRNGKEGILFSFTMSAMMIYVMAALNFGVRTGDVGVAAWSYALFNFPLAFVVGMICDLCLCTPASRKIMRAFCAPTDRPVWKGITVKFSMVVLMTVCMTIYGAIAAVGFGGHAIGAFFTMFPYNFTIALPIQMLIVAPIAGKIVHAVGDAAHWNEAHPQKAPSLGVNRVSDIMKSDVYTISKSSTILEALQVLVDKKISGAPVVDSEGKVKAFISDSDVLRYFAHDNLPVSDVSTLVTGMARGEYPSSTYTEVLSRNVMSAATRKVVSVDPDSNIEELCTLFGLQKLKKVPVLEEGKLVGIVNRSNLTRRSVEHFLATV